MTKTGWLIYRETDAQINSGFIDWFIDEANRQNLCLQLVYREDLTIGINNQERRVLYKGKRLTQPDFAVVRTIDYPLSLHLEAIGIHVFNSAKIAAMCNHKALTHHHMQTLHIPVADTIYLEKESLPQQAPLQYPFVLKDVYGRGGQQVYQIQTDNDWQRKASEIMSQQLLAQSSAHIKFGRDVRVFIVGNTIIGAVLRYNENDFRANFKLGGSVRLYSLTQKEIAMIKRIIQHFDFDMVGIDFLIDEQGNLLFNEIEDVVGSRTLSSVSDINILQSYCQHIARKLNS